MKNPDAVQPHRGIFLVVQPNETTYDFIKNQDLENNLHQLQLNEQQQLGKLKGLDDKTIQAIAEVLGQVDVDKLKLALGTMNDVQIKAIAEAIGKGDVEGLKTAINQLDPKTVQAIAQAFGYSDVNELIGAIDNLAPKTVQAVAQALGLSDVNTLQITVNNMHGNTVDAKVNTDGQASKIDTLQTKINSLKGKIVNVGVQIAAGGKKKAAQRTGSDLSPVNGTANVNGTTERAFKQGSWGTKNSGTALGSSNAGMLSCLLLL